MGKLGSRELTAGSDVDLILLYDHDADAEESDGDKPLAPSHYYTRMTQRLIAAVSAPTAEGVLYELDLRLRPSGNKGPVATHIDAFKKYQRQEAWTWEHMALTRARAIAGDAALCAEVEAEVAAMLALPRDAAKVMAEAVRDARDDRKGKAAARPLGHQADPGRADRSRIHRPGGGASPGRSKPAAARHRDGRDPVAPGAGFRRCPGQAGTWRRLCALSGADPDDHGSASPARSSATTFRRDFRICCWRSPTCRISVCWKHTSRRRRERSERISTFCFVRKRSQMTGGGKVRNRIRFRLASGVTMQQEKTMRKSTELALAFVALGRRRRHHGLCRKQCQRQNARGHDDAPQARPMKRFERRPSPSTSSPTP